MFSIMCLQSKPEHRSNFTISQIQLGSKHLKTRYKKKHVREHKHYCVKHKTPDLDANKQVGGNAKRRDIFTEFTRNTKHRIITKQKTNRKPKSVWRNSGAVRRTETFR